VDKWSLLVARETVVEQDRVEALNSDRNALEWKRKLGSRLSPEMDAILRPSSEKKAIDD